MPWREGKVRVCISACLRKVKDIIASGGMSLNTLMASILPLLHTCNLLSFTSLSD